MNLQFVADGLIAGATIGLGAVGVTLTYSTLRFANFAHGEFISWGCYLTWLLAGAIGAALPTSAAGVGALSIGWNVLAAGLLAMALTGLLAIALDAIVFRPLRKKGAAITAVIASFGASLALRAAIEAVFSSRPRYLSQELQIAIPIVNGLRVTPDQMALVLVTAVWVVILQVLLRTSVGRSMRAVSENPSLARVIGIDVDRVIRMTWFIGGALACAAGVMLGLVVQIRPTMGAELLLPLFAAAIFGGVGSVPGALLGGFVVGLAEAATVQLAGAEWRAAVAFLVVTAVLLVRPTGVFGRPA